MNSAGHHYSRLALEVVVPTATTGGVRRGEAIRRDLAQRAGRAPEASAIAAAAISAWGQVAVLLAPVIGARGIDAIFRRALHLTSGAYPWMAIAGEHEAGEALLENLRTRLAERETEVAAEASYRLMVTFAELLTSLIGEHLTERLLGPVWAPSPPTSKQESES